MKHFLPSLNRLLRPPPVLHSSPCTCDSVIHTPRLSCTEPEEDTPVPRTKLLASFPAYFIPAAVDKVAYSESQPTRSTYPVDAHNAPNQSQNSTNSNTLPSGSLP